MEYIRETEKNKKGLKGSTVVEMSYIIPLFLGLFVLILHAVFYYHDKAILNGAASETAILGAQAARRADAEYDLEAFFRDRTKSRLIYLTDISVTVRESEDAVEVSAAASRSIMKLDIIQKAEIVRPEKALRRMGVIQ